MNKRLAWTTLALALAAAAPVRAMSLAEAWQASLAHDPQYRAAGHERDVAREGVGVARAGALPSVNLQVSRSYVTGDREFGNSLNQTVRTPLDYEAPQTTLQARMPLFNDEVRARIDQAQAQAGAADAQYRSRRQELVDRLGTAYLAALLAQDNLQLARTQVEQARVQVDRAQRRLAQGEGTRTEALQAEAALTLARSREREATDQVAVALRDLQRITGQPLPGLKFSLEGLKPMAPEPAGLEAWLALALRQNPALEVKAQQIEAARQGVRRNRAGHLPRLDGVATLAQSSNESISSLNQKSNTQSVALQLTVPLFSGFGVQSGVRQAEADEQRVREEARALGEALELEVQRQYMAMQTGVGRIAAQEAAVAAQQMAVHAAQRSVDEGVGALANVLEAQALYFRALRDLAQVRQEYLLARLRLQAQAGTATDQVVQDIDRQLLPRATP